MAKRDIAYSPACSPPGAALPWASVVGALQGQLPLFLATFRNYIPAPMPATVPVDIGGPAVFTDTAGNKASITGGVYTVAGGTAAGDPGLWAPALARAAGRGVLFRGVTITDATAIAEFGYDANQAGALGGIGFQCNTDVLKGILAGTAGPTLYVPLDGVAYDLLVVPLATGGLLLLKLSTASLFSLLFRSSTGTTTPIYAAMSGNTAAFSVDSYTVLDLPQFSSQWGWCPVYVPLPPSVTPTVGASLWDAAASTFESGTYAWVRFGGNTIANVGNALQVTYVNALYGAYDLLRNDSDLSSNLVVGAWYRLQANWSVNAGGSIFPFVAGPNIYGAVVTNTSPEARVIAFRATETTGNYITMQDIGAGEIVTIDNLALYPVTFPTMLGTAYQAASEGWFEVGVTIPAGHVGGMMFCLDDETNPQNYLLAIHNRTSLEIIECVNGTQTPLLSTAATYGDARRICCQKIGNTMRCYYGAAGAEALIGAALTTTATSHTKMCTFGTDATVTYANLAYAPAYHSIPSWA